MAVTGKYMTVTPAARAAGFPVLLDKPEASVQTFYEGTPVRMSGGYLFICATDATLYYGFAAKAGQNGTSDGAKTGKVYRISPTALFEATLSVASWDQSLVGSHVAFSIVSSKCVLITTGNNTTNAIIEGLANPSVFAAGDALPTVLFTVANANIQGEV